MLDQIKSETSRKIYAERKQQVLCLLNEAQEFYNRDGNEQFADSFARLQKDLENGEFSIVLVGEFSAGKSTILNALMGKKILPSFSSETTATVNFLRHKEKASSGETGTVYYNDGKSEAIYDDSLATIQKYVSTRGNDVAASVDHLDLYLESDFLKDGVTLVDSPGLNGTLDGHREITEEQILKSHASIFVFNSQRPGSSTDFEFLNNLQKRVKTIILVLNQIDEIKSDEGETPESVIKILKNTYKRKFPEVDSVPEIWPIAAFPALVARNDEPLNYHDHLYETAEERNMLLQKSRMEEFEDRLMRFLTCGEKARAQLLEPVERVINLALETKTNYEEEIKAYEGKTDMDDVLAQIAEVEEAIAGVDAQIRGIRNEVSTQVRENIRDILESFSASLAKLKNRKIEEIEEHTDLEELNSYLQTFERNYINRVRSLAVNEDQDLKEQIVSIVRLHYSSQSSTIENQLMNEHAEAGFKVSEHLNTDEHFFEVGIKEMDDKIKALSDQLKEIEAQELEAEQQRIADRKIERKKAELKDQLRELTDRKYSVEAEILPAIESRTCQKDATRVRGGVLGLIATAFVGKKHYIDYVTEIDSSAHDAAKKDQERRSKALESEIADTKSAMAELKDTNPEYWELFVLRKKAEASGLREEIDRQNREAIKKIEDKYKKEIRRIKRSLSNYCDDMSDELEKEAKNYLRAREQRYIEIILDSVEGNLKATLGEKQAQLTRLKDTLSASEKEKKTKIDSLNGKISEICGLMEKAVKIETMISSVEVDEISREAI